MQRRFNGGCANCGGICSGAKTPKELLEQVLQYVEEGKMTGGQVAKVIVDYRGMGMNGEGFFGDFWSGLKKGFNAVVKPASAILGMLPIPQAQAASRILNVASGLTGNGRPRRRRLRRKTNNY